VPIPAGFKDWGDHDLAYRGMETSEFECASDAASKICFGIQVFSSEGCPGGVTVGLSVYDEDVDPETPISEASGVTPPIDPGGTQQVVIGETTGFDGNGTASLESMRC